MTVKQCNGLSIGDRVSRNGVGYEVLDKGIDIGTHSILLGKEPMTYTWLTLFELSSIQKDKTMTYQEWIEAIKPFGIGDRIVYTYSAPKITCYWCMRRERRDKTVTGRITAIDRDGITIKQLHGALVEKGYSYRMAREVK